MLKRISIDTQCLCGNIALPIVIRRSISPMIRQLLHALTSKSVKALYVRTRQPPKNIQVARFLVSVKDVTRGTDPICQSCESMAGHNSNQQLSAAR